MSREKFTEALESGRSADVGDANPYAGQGVLADLWRAGYRTMLERRVAESVDRHPDR